MSSEQQDAIARRLLDFAADEAPEPLDPEDIAEIEEGLPQIEHGEFTTEKEVAAIFRRFRKP